MSETEAHYGDWERLFARNKAVFDWCLRSANRALGSHRPDQAAEWCALAAHSAAFQGWFGRLASPELEALLLRIGAALPPAPRRSTSAARTRWLHILTTAYEIGGHTNMLCRWVKKRSADEEHHAIVTTQIEPLPKKLKETVDSSGGTLTVLDPQLSVLEKARSIKTIATNIATVVVLHTHPHDVAPALAFGTPGDIPVLLMNHADHLFWVGLGVADRILEFRDLGAQWTRQYRGVNRSCLLPLPLDDALASSRSDPAMSAAARERLGIPPQAVVLLTVASHFKYEPVGSWNFQAAVGQVLAKCPEVLLFAIGPRPSNAWQTILAQYPNRIYLVSDHADISNGDSDYQLAADIALGSYPFASQTATLESGLMGLPCVLTPRDIPYGLDDPAFADISWPKTQDDFINQIIRLAKDPALRATTGSQLSQAIARHHCGKEWEAYFESIATSLPQQHQTYLQANAQPLPIKISHFWASFTKLDQARPLSAVHGAIIAGHLPIAPKHDLALKRALGWRGDSMPFPNLRYHLRKVRYIRRRRAMRAAR